MGTLKNYYGKFDESLEYYKRGYHQSIEENNPALTSKCLLSLMISTYSQGEYERALNYAEKLKNLLDVTKKYYLAGAMHFYVAKAYYQLNMPEKALRHYGHSNRILNNKRCWNLQGYILLSKGIIHRELGLYKDALIFFKLASEATDKSTFKRLYKLLANETRDANKSSVDIYFNWDRRTITERHLGTIDFRHRFVLLEILYLLAKNQGTSFSKEKLAPRVWKTSYNPLIHDTLIYTSVSRLRRLIEPPGDKKHRYILRSKNGYKFNPESKIHFHSKTTSRSDDSMANVGLSYPV